MEINTTFLENTSATSAVADNMQTYIRYSNTEFLPNTVDGLKLLWRRILLVLNHSDKMMKCTALTGACMQTYHPHGDSGVEDGIISLGQPFKQAHPWLVIKGNYGAYGGAQAAAGRYLDVFQSPFTKDIFFNHVDSRTLTYIPSETGEGVEPLYLIPVIPTSLLFGGKRLAAGYMSNTPFLNFCDVCTLVEKYINLRRKYPMNYNTKFGEIAKYCLPDFPSHSIIRNKKTVIEEYSKGNFNCPIIMDGVMELEPNAIRIKSIPYGTTQFEDVLTKKLGPKMNSANFVSAATNEIMDLSTGIDYGNIAIKLKRNVNPFEVLDKFKTECTFTQSWTPQWFFVDKDGFVVEMNPMKLLDVWYVARHRSILAGLKFINNDLFKQYRKLSALIVIADHTDEVLEIFKESENRDATIPKLIKAFGFTREQAEYISSLQLHQITKQGKDDLLKALAEIKEKIEEHQKKFINIDDIMINEARELSKTYANECKRRTRIPKYIGVIQIPEYNGYIQFESVNELVHLFHRWSKSFDVKISFYDNDIMVLSSQSATPDIDPPKEFMCDKLAILHKKPKSSIILKSGYIFRVDEFVSNAGQKGICEIVGDEFLAIKKGYKLVEIRTTDIPRRASTDAAGSRTDIVYFNGIMADKVIVAIADTNYMNVVILKVMKPGDTHKQPLLGKSQILGMWKFGDPISLILPEMFVSRCSTRRLLVLDSEKFMNGNKELQVNFNRKKTSDGRDLGYLHKNAEILSDTNLKGKLE